MCVALAEVTVLLNDTCVSPVSSQRLIVRDSRGRRVRQHTTEPINVSTSTLTCRSTNAIYKCIVMCALLCVLVCRRLGAGVCECVFGLGELRRRANKVRAKSPAAWRGVSVQLGVLFCVCSFLPRMLSPFPDIVYTIVYAAVAC